MDARSILGLQHVRPPLLDDLSVARPTQAQARHRARVVIRAGDDLDDDPDEDDEDFDEDEDAENEDEEDDEDEEDEDVETWQVSESIRCPKGRPLLDFGERNCLDWLRFDQLNRRWTDSAGLASRLASDPSQAFVTG